MESKDAPPDDVSPANLQIHSNTNTPSAGTGELTESTLFGSDGLPNPFDTLDVSKPRLTTSAVSSTTTGPATRMAPRSRISNSSKTTARQPSYAIATRRSSRLSQRIPCGGRGGEGNSTTAVTAVTVAAGSRCIGGIGNHDFSCTRMPRTDLNTCITAIPTPAVTVIRDGVGNHPDSALFGLGPDAKSKSESDSESYPEPERWESAEPRFYRLVEREHAAIAVEPSPCVAENETEQDDVVFVNHEDLQSSGYVAAKHANHSSLFHFVQQMLC